MKKIFILTGEPSGDKLAAEVIKELKKCLPDLQISITKSDSIQNDFNVIRSAKNMQK